VALAGSGRAYAVDKLADCAKKLVSSRSLLSRELGAFRYEEDTSVQSLEAAIVRVLTEVLDSRDANSSAALKHLWYFSGVDYASTCRDSTVVQLPHGVDDIDRSLLINARLALAGRGYFARDNLINCMLPIINGGEAKGNGNSCKLRRKAAELYRRYHGADLAATGTYLPGSADCSELITNEVMWAITTELAKEALGCGSGILAKTAISATSLGFKTFKMIKRGQLDFLFPESGSEKFGTGRIGEYAYFMQQVRASDKWVDDVRRAGGGN